MRRRVKRALPGLLKGRTRFVFLVTSQIPRSKKEHNRRMARPEFCLNSKAQMGDVSNAAMKPPSTIAIDRTRLPKCFAHSRYVDGKESSLHGSKHAAGYCCDQ